MLTELPTGTVTFLFTDIAGSTRLLHELGDGYADVLAEHRRVLREAWRQHDGVEVDTQGDAFFVAFSRATDAVAAAADAQSALADGPVKVRMGLHTGEPVRGGEGYVGFDVHRAARIAAAGHGGQVLLSQATVDLAGADVRDLGLHRLKDLSAPERIFQLGTDRFPPLKTLHETNLPVPATPFLGREQEVDQIATLLRRPDVRLVTLTGPGGSGKTRLALQAAGAAADDYGHGVWWVPLSSLADPTLVDVAASQALGSEDALAETVGDKRLMLVFDNFEHLVDAAANVAETIVSCPRLTVLVTSREPLHIDGEWEVAVDPLQEREAIELFVQRAVAARSDFTADDEVAEICRRLDCLPLAIELAAARVKVLALPALLERLEQRLPLLAGGSRSAPERQRTLRATIAWSYELLEPTEQAMFAELAVFAGGCTLEAAEEICGADVDAIASLVDKSLIRRSGDRYWMLQTIREYAREVLEQSGEAAAAVRGRHAGHYLAVAELADAERFEKSLRRLKPENDNLRAALDHFQDRSPSQYLQLAGALGPFWDETLQFAEGAQRLEDALASARDEGPQTARALAYLGVLDSVRGEFSFGVSRLEQAIEIWRVVGDETRLWEAQDELGWALYRAGENSRALEVFEQNLELARSRDLDKLLQSSLRGVCQLLLANGQFERAEPLAEELGNNHYLADCAQQRRDYTSAEHHRLRALESAVMAGDDYQQTLEVFGLSMIAGGLGRDEDAVRLEGAVEATWDELGIASRPQVLETWRERDLGGARARLGEARAAALYGEGRAMSWDETLDLALGKTQNE